MLLQTGVYLPTQHFWHHLVSGIFADTANFLNLNGEEYVSRWQTVHCKNAVTDQRGKHELNISSGDYIKVRLQELAKQASG